MNAVGEPPLGGAEVLALLALDDLDRLELGGEERPFSNLVLPGGDVERGHPLEGGEELRLGRLGGPRRFRTRDQDHAVVLLQEALGQTG